MVHNFQMAQIIDTRLIIGIDNGSENGNNPRFACP